MGQYGEISTKTKIVPEKIQFLGDRMDLGEHDTLIHFTQRPGTIVDGAFVESGEPCIPITDINKKVREFRKHLLPSGFVNGDGKEITITEADLQGLADLIGDIADWVSSDEYEVKLQEDNAKAYQTPEGE